MRNSGDVCAIHETSKDGQEKAGACKRSQRFKWLLFRNNRYLVGTLPVFCAASKKKDRN